MRSLRLFAIAIMILLVASSSFAVTAERGDFAILGASEEDDAGETILIEENVLLNTGPAVDVVNGKLKPGTVVQVLDRVEIESVSYYSISTVGPEGGIIGWGTEDYIYELTERPVY